MALVSEWATKLVEVLHGANASSGLFVMAYKSYMDETGIQFNDPYCTIGGFVGIAKVWDDFEYRWRWLLKEYMRGIPEDDRYFHALEFYGSGKQYVNWKPGKKKAFIGDLFQAINAFDLTVFSTTIDVKVFRSMTEDERRWLTGGVHNGMKWKKQGAPTKPYFLPFQDCIIQSAECVPDGDQVFPVMSRQDQYKIRALELYDEILEAYPALKCRSKLADDMVFSNPKKVPALQAADLAAYWIGQSTTYRAKTGETSLKNFPGKIEMRSLFKNAKSLHNFKFYDFQGLMLNLQAANRHIKTSFPTLDQMLPSLPIEKRREILAVMRKVDFRPFLDQWKPSGQEDRGETGIADAHQPAQGVRHL